MWDNASPHLNMYKKGLFVFNYLRLSVKRTNAGAAVYIPDADMTVAGPASSCKYTWLPRAPGQSLK